MSIDPQDLLDNNRAWAARVLEEDPTFFARLSEQQRPEFLWIGCSDSRVPSNQITGLPPGEVFVHRNVANVVLHTDLNCLSVIEYAVKVLKVRHIIVCGHYGCGGVQAAYEGARVGMVDNWLRGIRDLYESQRKAFDAMAPDVAVSKLCEKNVLRQAASVCNLNIVRDAWTDGQALTVHGWIYDIGDGLLQELIRVNGQDGVAALEAAV